MPMPASGIAAQNTVPTAMIIPRTVPRVMKRPIRADTVGHRKAWANEAIGANARYAANKTIVDGMGSWKLLWPADCTRSGGSRTARSQKIFYTGRATTVALPDCQSSYDQEFNGRSEG